MGQYYKGNKIGTCESMYYMRLDEAKKLAERGERDDDKIAFADYLKDNQTKWRFPFPDEDAGIPEDCKYNKGFNLPVGKIDVNHDRICVSNQHENGGYNVNIFLPCPYSQDFKDQRIETSNGGAGEQFLTVRFQAIRDGKEKTIFSCARCGELQRFDEDSIEQIKKRAIEHYSVYDPTGRGPDAGDKSLFDYAMEVIKRIK